MDFQLSGRVDQDVNLSHTASAKVAVPVACRSGNWTHTSIYAV
jgi:hypothetical protein